MTKVLAKISLKATENSCEDKNTLLFVYFRGYAYVDEKGYTQPILGAAEKKKTQ